MVTKRAPGRQVAVAKVEVMVAEEEPAVERVPTLMVEGAVGEVRAVLVVEGTVAHVAMVLGLMVEAVVPAKEAGVRAAEGMEAAAVLVKGAGETVVMETVAPAAMAKGAEVKVAGVMEMAMETAMGAWVRVVAERVVVAVMVKGAGETVAKDWGVAVETAKEGGVRAVEGKVVGEVGKWRRWQG